MTIVEPIRNKAILKKLENVLSKESQRNLILFTIGTNCGLRISDILALNVGDVKDKNYIQIIEKKTGKFKKFPINAKLKPMLESFTKGKKHEEPLFKTVFGNRFDSRGSIGDYFSGKDTGKFLSESFRKKRSKSICRARMADVYGGRFSAGFCQRLYGWFPF